MNTANAATLVGRDSELARLDCLLSEAFGGTGRVVLLDGEPGVGKTRLARELLTRVRRYGAQSFVGRCFEQYTRVAYFPFTELLPAALAAAPDALQDQVARLWPELAWFLPEVASADEQDLRGPGAKLRMFRATREFLRAMAETHPVVLFLDDLQWADASSLDLLLFLARNLDDMRVFIVGAYRDSEAGLQRALEVLVRELVSDRFAEVIHLRPLTADGTAGLIRLRLGLTSPPQQLIEIVHARAQGNPFFTEELLAAFAESGALTASGDRIAELNGLRDLEVPPTIRSVISERIERLPTGCKQLLELASVLGQEFELEVLLRAAAQPAAAVLDAFDAAVNAHIIEKQHGDSERFGFTHSLVQQTLYKQLAVHERRSMHLQVGMALETEHRPPPPTLFVQLARHFLLGGDTRRAARYSVDAGDQASSQYAHTEAVHQYRQALDLLDISTDASLVARVHFRLASELYDLNQLGDALTAYETARDGFERLGNRHGQALAEWGIACLHEGRYDMALARGHVREALRLWPVGLEDADWVRLLVDASRITTYAGAAAEALGLAEQGLRTAERIGNPGPIARALFGLSVVRVNLTPTIAEINPILDRAIDLAKQASDWRTLTRLYLNRATNYWLLGNLYAATSDRRCAVAAAERSGEMERLVFAHETLGTTLVDFGEWQEARAALRAGLALDPEGRFRSVSSACLAWVEGRYEQALVDVQAAVARARQKLDFQDVTLGLSALAEFLIQLGRVAEAEAPAREALRLARDHWQMLAGVALSELAEAAACAGVADAEAIVTEGLEQVNRYHFELLLPQILRAQAILLARRGAFGDAVRALDSSATSARSRHALVELAATLAALATLGRQLGRRELVQRADAERLELIDHIGVEAHGLAWAQGLTHLRHLPAAEPGQLLSAREQEVAGLIVGGLSNRQIADRLVISERTVENHVSSIMAKLGLSSRAQVAVWTVQHGFRSN